MAEVTKFAKQIKLDTDKLLGDWIVCIPGFTLQKYRQLQKSQLSIFSINCFGGFISNILGLQFRSPFVNLFMHQEEFVRLLRHPKIYLEEKLIFQQTAWEHALKWEYPVYTLGNVSLYMNHYPNFDEAVRKWNDRKQRINWYNLIAIMDTDKPEILEKFDVLPYGKKVCFVPFKSNFDSAFYINPKLQKAKIFSLETLRFARAEIFYYDMFDMLLYGKKNQLIDM